MWLGLPQRGEIQHQHAEDDIPEDQRQFIQINAELARLWPPLTKSKESLPEAEKWSGVADKLQHLIRD